MVYLLDLLLTMSLLMILKLKYYYNKKEEMLSGHSTATVWYDQPVMIYKQIVIFISKDFHVWVDT